MKLEFGISIEQKQTLSMTPELIQAIAILQYNAQELELYVEKQLEENPLLDAEDDDEASLPYEEDFEYEEAPIDDPRAEKIRGEEDFDWGEYLNEREYDDISYKSFGAVSAASREDSQMPETASGDDVTLSSHLLSQLAVADISDKKRAIGEYIIESLDDSGYMSQSAEEIAETLSEDIVRVRKVITFLRTFDPVGVAATDLQDCLRMQIDASENMTEADRISAKAIVTEHLDDLAANRLAIIAKSIKRTVTDVQRLCDSIRALEPKPGSRFGENDTRYILPDAIVERGRDGYTISLNEATSPQLHVSPYYRRVLAGEDRNSETAKFLAGRLNSAVWLIKSIEQRNQTIYNVVKAIVDYQMDFFDDGEKYLKPLTLKMIADAVGIHESTVSRTVNGKYVQTPRGIYELKYFFGSGVSGQSPGGVSSESVTALIREMIAAENVMSPLSDRTIAETLAARGIDISRRTVAKYREAAGIPSSSGRKRYR